MASVDALGLIGDIMVGGSVGYASGAAAQQAEDKQRSDRELALNSAKVKQEGMLRLEQWKAQNVRDVAKQKHEYSMEEQAESLASKERIAGMNSPGAGGVPGKERIKGVANLRSDYKDFIDNEFVSGADEGWWFGIGEQEGDEPPTFEEWAHGARPEEAKYYGVPGSGQKRLGDVQLEGSVADIIGRVNLGGGGGDVVEPQPITYEEQPQPVAEPRRTVEAPIARERQAPGERPVSGMVARIQEERRSAEAGSSRAQEESRASANKRREKFNKVKKDVSDFLTGKGKTRAPKGDKIQKMPGSTARAVAEAIGLPNASALTENPKIAWEIAKAVRDNKTELLAELIKQL